MRFKTLIVSEFMTSQRCAHCGGELLHTRGAEVRHYRCEHDAAKVEINKDCNAALAMIKIGLSLLLANRRPTAFTSGN